MRRNFLLTALAACALLVASAPIASAARHRAPRAHSAVSGKKVWKAIHQLNGQFAGASKNFGVLQKNDLGFETRLTDLSTRLGVIEGAAPVIIDGLLQLKDGSLKLKDGLEKLGAAVQDQVVPGLTALKSALEDKVQPALITAGEYTVGAAGTGDPNADGTTTTADEDNGLEAIPTSDLPPGTTYRQFVQAADSNLSGGLKAAIAGGTLPIGTLPLGVRTWVKMPNSPSPLDTLYPNTWACMTGTTTITSSQLQGLGIPNSPTPYADLISASTTAMCADQATAATTLAGHTTTLASHTAELANHEDRITALEP